MEVYVYKEIWGLVGEVRDSNGSRARILVKEFSYNELRDGVGVYFKEGYKVKDGYDV